MRCTLILGLTAATLAADMANAAEKKLDGAGIKATLDGARIYVRGGDVTIQFKADGTFIGTHVRGFGRSDVGKWWVEGDRYCRKWNNWNKATTACWFVYRDGANLRFQQIGGRRSEKGRIAR
jgi:GntR family transcriptional regulator/MocR family aminotransferase